MALSKQMKMGDTFVAFLRLCSLGKINEEERARKSSSPSLFIFLFTTELLLAAAADQKIFHSSCSLCFSLKYKLVFQVAINKEQET